MKVSELVKNQRNKIAEIYCNKFGILEPIIDLQKGILVYYEWAFADVFGRKEYYKQTIDLDSMEFTNRKQLKKKPKFYCQHI